VAQRVGGGTAPLPHTASHNRSGSRDRGTPRLGARPLRGESDTLPLTRDSLSEILGVRRTTLTVVPGALQEGGRGSPTRWSQPAAKDPAGIENTERCLDRRERGLSGCGKQRWLQPRFESVIPALFWARLVRAAAVHGLRPLGSAFGFGIEIHRLRRSHPSIP
jgi:hypothetical protein